jgi:hypothetical protein
MFPGQGSQYAGMGTRAARGERRSARRSTNAPRRCAPKGSTCADIASATTRRRSTSDHAITQPATFAVEYALARMWMAYGRAAGGDDRPQRRRVRLRRARRRDDARRRAARWSRGAAADAGAAAGRDAVGAAVAAGLEARLPPGCRSPPRTRPMPACVAGPDGRGRVVPARLEAMASAPRAAAHLARVPLGDDGSGGRPVPRRGRGVPRRRRDPDRVDGHGRLADRRQATDAGLLGPHLREPVRVLGRRCRQLLRPPGACCSNGPARHAVGAGAPASGARAAPFAAVASLADNGRRRAAARARRAGQLWCARREVDPARLRTRRAPRVALPTYPFERQRYWVDSRPSPRRPQRAHFRRCPSIAARAPTRRPMQTMPDAPPSRCRPVDYRPPRRA